MDQAYPASPATTNDGAGFDLKDNPMLRKAPSKNRTAKALEDSVLTPWWTESRGGSASGKGRKVAKFNGEPVGDQVTARYLTTRFGVYYNWTGTIARKVFVRCCLYALASAAFISFYAGHTSSSCDKEWDAVDCRPAWMVRLCQPLSTVFRPILLATALLLAILLVHGHNTYMHVANTALELQDHVVSLSMAVGTAVVADAESAAFEARFERLLCLAHTLAYIEAAQAWSIVRRLSIRDLTKSRILGLKLLENVEAAAIRKFQKFTSASAFDLVLVWMAQAFDAAMFDSLFRVNLTSERALALSKTFQEHLCKLRNAAAALGYHHEHQLPVFISETITMWTHLVCFLGSITIAYHAQNSYFMPGFLPAGNPYLSMPACAVASFLFTYAVWGTVELARTLTMPLGNPYFDVNARDALGAKKNQLDIPVILRNTRMATFIFFNSRRGIQKPPLCEI